MGKKRSVWAGLAGLSFLFLGAMSVCAAPLSCDKRAAYFTARAQTAELKTFLENTSNGTVPEHVAERPVLTGPIARMGMAPLYIYMPLTPPFPVLALMASWNLNLAKSAGNMIGEWAHQSSSSAVMISSTSLLHAQNSTPSATAGEDPVLAGKMMGAYLQGVEAQHILPVLDGIGITGADTMSPAHFPERGAFENDLFSTKLALEAGNTLLLCKGADFCSAVEKGPRFLRKLWAFQGGIIMKGSHDFQKTGKDTSLAKASSLASMENYQKFIDAGVDSLIVGKNATAHVRDLGREAAQLRERARHIIYSYCKAGLLDHHLSDHHTPLSGADHVPTGFLEQVAEESAVLLQNEGNILPLSPHGGGIILLYDDAYGKQNVTALQNALQREIPGRKITLAFIAEKDRLHKISMAETVIVLVGEENEQTVAVVKDMIRQDVPLIVVLADDDVQALPWVTDSPAVIKAWSVARAGNAALARLLSGKRDFSGHLPFSIPNEKDERQKMQTPVALGYKAYDQAHKAPLFPFGYGLSTSGNFTLLNFKVQNKGVQMVASFDVKNKSDSLFIAVPQLYIDLPLALEEGVKRLGGWRKVTLKPRETVHVTLPVDKRLFARWDENAHEWWIVPGVYGLSLGSSAVTLTNHIMIRLPDIRFTSLAERSKQG